MGCTGNSPPVDPAPVTEGPQVAQAPVAEHVPAPAPPPKPRPVAPNALVERSHSEINLAAGDSATVSTQVQRYVGGLTGCYTVYLVQSDEDRKGQMVVQLDIEAGQVTAATMLRDPTSEPGFAECVTTRISRWRFPKSTTGELKQAFALSWTPAVTDGQKPPATRETP